MVARSHRLIEENVTRWRRGARRRLRASKDDLLFIAGLLVILALVTSILLIIWLFARWIVLAICAWLMFLGLKTVADELSSLSGSRHE